MGSTFKVCNVFCKAIRHCLSSTNLKKLKRGVSFLIHSNGLCRFFSFPTCDSSGGCSTHAPRVAWNRSFCL